MPETAYIVLRLIEIPPGDDGRAWVDADRVEASSAAAAIRLACKNDDKPAGTYVAVPKRSWMPVQVSAVQQTVLKLEGAPTTETGG